MRSNEVSFTGSCYYLNITNIFLFECSRHIKSERELMLGSIFCYSVLN